MAVHFGFGEELVVLSLEEMAVQAVADVVGSWSDKGSAVLIGGAFN